MSTECSTTTQVCQAQVYDILKTQNADPVVGPAQVQTYSLDETESPAQALRQAETTEPAPGNVAHPIAI